MVDMTAFIKVRITATPQAKLSLALRVERLAWHSEHQGLTPVRKARSTSGFPISYPTTITITTHMAEDSRQAGLYTYHLLVCAFQVLSH